MKPYFETNLGKLYYGDCRNILSQLSNESVHCCVTSPPYWGLRDYGTEPLIWDGKEGCEHVWGEEQITTSGRNDSGEIRPNFHGQANGYGGNRKVSQGQFCQLCGVWKGSLGLEPTPEMFIYHLVQIFREVKRVLRDDGTIWVNMGDSYNGSGGAGGDYNKGGLKEGQPRYPGRNISNLKPKDLIGIPWMLAFALRTDGWYLRSDIIWCLSGGTWLYARTQRGDMPITVRDLARLKFETVQLWNGKRWTQLLGINKHVRKGTEIEIVLKSGERISCTPTHKWPTKRGLLKASELKIGDILESCIIPEPNNPLNPDHISLDAAWFVGLYLAEGSKSNDCIQLSGHTKEVERWERVKKIAESYGGSATKSENGNTQNIRVYGKLLCALLSELVTGKTAKDKGIAPHVWRYSNKFLENMIDGYLSGDGHWDEPNQRWRLGFTRNYNLERDLRTACARLGYKLTLNLSITKYQGGQKPAFRGELRKTSSDHFNNRDRAEIIKIRKSRCRNIYDIGVADEPHLFSLASGILTHNSKPNPMPESVKDRPTKAHEYIFLLSKSQKYFYDGEAIKEPNKMESIKRYTYSMDGCFTPGTAYPNEKREKPQNWKLNENGRNRRSVWTVTTQPFPEAHFATFPPKLIKPCIFAGCPDGGTVLDPFFGAGTVGIMCEKLNRKWIGTELNESYCEIAARRIEVEAKQLKMFVPQQ